MFAAFLIILFFGHNPTQSQGSVSAGAADDSTAVAGKVQIDKIFIIGNRKTREKIILRELNFKAGDTLDETELTEYIELDKNKILNTKLFLSVDFNVIEINPEKVDVIIRVVERWYIFPIPLFELADRNFNEWWVNQKRDFDRVNYGIRLFKFNMRGRNETLKLLAQFGYTKKFGLSYNFPYIDLKQKIGLNLVAEYSENNDFNYITIGDKQQGLGFLEPSRWMLKNVRLGMKLSYRRTFYNVHDFSVDYFNNRIKDTVAALNPNYLLDGRTGQKYFHAQYTFTRDLRDAKSYPLEGFLLRMQAAKIGLGLFNDVDHLRLSANYAYFFNLKNNFYLSTEIGGSSIWPRKLPYNFMHALGFEPFDIRGYELYVVDGQHLAYNRLTLKNRLYQNVFSNPMIPIKQFQTFPLALYVKTFFDMGYVSSSWNIPEGNRFVNKLLIGGGVGLDIVTYYDMALRCEYTLNGEGESSFVFGLKREF